MNTWKEMEFSFEVENDIHYTSAINNCLLIFNRTEWLRQNPYFIILSSTCIKYVWPHLAVLCIIKNKTKKFF